MSSMQASAGPSSATSATSASQPRTVREPTNIAGRPPGSIVVAPSSCDDQVLGSVADLAELVGVEAGDGGRGIGRRAGGRA